MVTDSVVARLPADALVLLVGPSGSGKSTWASARFEAAQVLSSDALRYWVAGDAADQSASADAFKALHLIARARVHRGLLTVVDATNLSRRARRSLLGIAEGSGRPAVAIAFDISLERCLAQNSARPDRDVPEQVIRRHRQEMTAALAELPVEGYVEVHVVRDAEIGSG